jgi:hypothetical protein
VAGGTGQDFLYGGVGNDVVDAIEYDDQGNQIVTEDHIYCGGGFDRVYADSMDKIASDCERTEIS